MTQVIRLLTSTVNLNNPNKLHQCTTKESKASISKTVFGSIRRSTLVTTEDPPPTSTASSNKHATQLLIRPISPRVRCLACDHQVKNTNKFSTSKVCWQGGLRLICLLCTTRIVICCRGLLKCLISAKSISKKGGDEFRI